VRFVREFYATFKRGHIAALLNTLANDVAFFIAGPQRHHSFVGQRKGCEQVRPVLCKTCVVVQGDKIVAIGHTDGR